MENNIVKVDNEYGELLQRCVAVIEQARTAIAKIMNTTSMTAYWEIGKLLYERKIDSKHGSAIVRRLSIDLKERYPDMGIG